MLSEDAMTYVIQQPMLGNTTLIVNASLPLSLETNR